MVRATITALSMLRSPEQVARVRNKETAELGVA
jgi:ribosomal protein S5